MIRKLCRLCAALQAHISAHNCGMAGSNLLMQLLTPNGPIHALSTGVSLDIEILNSLFSIFATFKSLKPITVLSEISAKALSTFAPVDLRRLL